MLSGTNTNDLTETLLPDTALPIDSASSRSAPTDERPQAAKDAEAKLRAAWAATEQTKASISQPGNNVAISIIPTGDVKKDFETLEALINSDPRLQKLNTLAPLFEKYKWRSEHTVAAFVTLLLNAMASKLYWDQGENLLEKMGGCGTNSIQNIVYGYLTYYFIKDSLKGSKLSLGLTLAVGGWASTSSAIAALQTGIFSMVINLLGATPNNAVGSYSLKERIASLYNSAREQGPDLREFTRTQITTILEQAKLSHFTKNSKTERGLLNNLSTAILFAGCAGVGILAQAGYTCNSADFWKEKSGSLGVGIALSVLGQLPTFGNALLISGLQIARLFVDGFDHYVFGKKKLWESSRECKFLVGMLASWGVAAFFSYYSSRTSVNLYESCPSDRFPDFLDDVMRFCVDIGTRFYNTAVAGPFALGLAFTYSRIAYSTGADRERYQADKWFDWINTVDKQTLEKFTDEAFPTEKTGWKALNTNGLTKNSVFTNPDGYAPLAGEEQKLDQEQADTKRMTA